MRKKLIIFDFDGTLGDTRRTIVTTMQMTIKELQLPGRSDDECAATIGLPLMCFEASETLVVGDMAVDILMGVNAGAKTCGVTWGNGTKKELQEAGADFIIDYMKELIEIADKFCSIPVLKLIF